MAKTASDAEMDAALAYIQSCDLMVVCSAEPSSYADATTGVDLADVALSTPADLVIADNGTGRKLTVAAKSAIPIDHSGTATHIALCKVSDTTLRAVTTCSSQALTGGGTVDVPAIVFSIANFT
jgi:hypothetical protein